MIDGPFLWYLNRGTGIVILVLLTTSTVLGVLALGQRSGRAVPRFVTQALHRNLALLSIVVLAVHVCSAVLDSFVDIRWWQAISPVGATYQPLWLGLGTVALDLTVVVVVTSVVRSRLNHRTWFVVHLLSWAVWLAAVAHSIGIGTDLRDGTRWAVIPTVACVAAVVAAAAVRLLHLRSENHSLVRSAP